MTVHTSFIISPRASHNWEHKSLYLLWNIPGFQWSIIGFNIYEGSLDIYKTTI